MASTGAIRIGISGWRYKGWRGSFYPSGLPQRSELEFAARHFNTLELNGSFYSLQRPEHFQRWYRETPPEFIFAVKGSRYITHMLRLLKIESALANFFAQGVLCLEEKLGPILWQFPPQFRFDPVRLEAFFALLPRSRKEAAELGSLHDHRLDGRAWLSVKRDAVLRHAIEIRNDTFVCEEFIGLLRKHRIGLVVADTVEWPLLMDLTADFVYCRLHGSKQLYASGYGPKAIAEWGARVHAWAHGLEANELEMARRGKKAGRGGSRSKPRDVFVYFDNDAKVRAPFDAKKLSAAVARLELAAAA
jgi:uncharacterized protein YecE (DUF72 family)